MHQTTNHRKYFISPFTHLKIDILNPKAEVWKMIILFQLGDFQVQNVNFQGVKL